MEVFIEVKDSLTAQSTFHKMMKKQLSLGREEGNDVVIQNHFISNRHLTIDKLKEKIKITDEQTTNGTMINKNDRWIPVPRAKWFPLPIHLKLAGTVDVYIQSKDSMIYSNEELRQKQSIMVLDLSDSTKMANMNDKIALHLKQRTASISKPILYKKGVNFYKSTGDGFVATFSETKNAFSAAKNIMKAIERRNRNTSNPLIHCRIALHWGIVYNNDPILDDIHGNDVNITFRIEGVKRRAFRRVGLKLPKTDRIICSEAFYQSVIVPRKPYGVGFRLLGSASLKGISEKTALYLAEIH